MGALIRALTNNAVENIEEALGMTDATSSAMKHAIAEWYAAWYGRAPTKTEDPCQRLPYAIVNKLCKATFGEYDSSLQHTDSAKAKYLDGVRSTFDACKTSFMTQAMIGGEAWAKPVPMPDGRLTWQIVGRDSVIILGRDASGIPSDVALCEKSVSADHHFYTLVERRTSFAGRLTIQYRLYCSDNKSTLGRRVPLASLPQYERLEDEYTFAVPIDGVGMVFLRMPTTNCVDGSADGVSIYEPAMGLIHRINENELQFSREFELGRMRVVASADILRTHNGKKLLTDDVFVGLDGNEQSVGITPFAPALRNESYEARRQGEVSSYYAEKGDPLFEKLQSIIDNDLVLDDLKTDIVEVKLWDAQSSGAFPAVREECYIEVSSYGGDTTGYQIPFNVHYTGVKTKGTFNPTTKAFTAEA